MTKLSTAVLIGIATLSTTAFGAPAGDTLADILAAQPEEARARYQYRHPEETLDFFGIEPGMTVLEVLPGGGWYTKILLPYLGADGKLIGVDYAIDTWVGMGYDNEDFMAGRATWIADWTERAAGWAGGEGAAVDAVVLGSLPEALHGSADAVLFIRAMHGINRAGPDGVHLKAAFQDAWDALKPGGMVGIVQHYARDEMSDAWANGANGYLKKGYVIDLMEASGFEFAGETDINANDKDRPTESDHVWRLLPRMAGVEEDDAEGIARMTAIGESHRMTLKFVKR